MEVIKRKWRNRGRRDEEGDIRRKKRRKDSSGIGREKGLNRKLNRVKVFQGMARG